jgi:hypothetical protein
MLLEMLFQHVLYPNRSRQGVYFAAAYSILHGMILYTILHPRLRPVRSTCSRQCKAAPLYYLLRISTVRRVPPSSGSDSTPQS